MRTASICLALALLMPVSAWAQRWTAEEQGVIDHVKQCWDAWAEAVAQRDLEIWMNTCQPAEDFAGWWTSDGALWTLESERRSFDHWVQGVKRFYWESVQPLEVKVYGDVALMWYYGVHVTEDPKGDVTRTQDKRFAVFRRVNSVWRWTGAMVTGKPIGMFVDESD